jgi:polyisoprenoid-binding protein YceI
VKYPTITFKSVKAVAAGPGHFTVTGDLTIHAVTRGSHWTSKVRRLR